MSSFTCHGTYADYQAHLRFNEKPCAACANAQRDYMRLYRIRTGHTTSSLISFPLLAQLAGHVPTGLLEQLVSEVGGPAFFGAIQAQYPPADGTPTDSPAETVLVSA